MTLHARESVRSSLDDSVYSSKDTAKAAPKYRFPTDEWRPRRRLRGGLRRADARRQRPPEPGDVLSDLGGTEVHRLMDLAIDKNMIDKDEYPQTAEIERRCVHMLADLWNAPESANTVGASAIGSSEACMLGGMAAKWRWRAEAGSGRSSRRSSEHGVRTGPGRVAQVRQVLGHRDPRGPDVAGPLRRWTSTTCCERVDENTIMVVPTFGVTYTGAYELVKPLANALDTLQADTGLDIDIHVDGASGAFLGPFCCARHRVGLPAAAGEVDQHVRAQVRAGAARRRLGRVA